ncbi:MAG TPA: hypothetical protein VN373_00720, partial [Methanosarcina barkeri]|nr:hypothetical protein [Methanosarcina barkeri]
YNTEGIRESSDCCFLGGLLITIAIIISTLYKPTTIGLLFTLAFLFAIIATISAIKHIYKTKPNKSTIQRNRRTINIGYKRGFKNPNQTKKPPDNQ